MNLKPYLNKIKNLKDSELLPHYIGTGLGIVAAVLVGGLITDRADASAVVIEHQEVEKNDETDS